MKLKLLLAGPYLSCTNTQQIWQDECTKSGIALESVFLESEAGTSLANQLNLTTFPALIQESKVIAVGHPDKQTAEKLLSNLVRNQ